MPRESLADAFATLDAAGVSAGELDGGRRAPLRRARAHGPPHRGDAPHRARGTSAHRAPARRSSTTRHCPHPMLRAIEDRPGGGGHDSLADGRGALASTARRGRDPAGPLVRGAELLGRRAAPRPLAARPGAGAPAARCVSAAGSAATSTGIRTPGPTRSRTRSSEHDSSRASCTAARSASSGRPGACPARCSGVSTGCRTTTSRSGRRLVEIWGRLADDAYRRRRRAARRSRRARRDAAGAPRRAHRRRRARRRPRARPGLRAPPLAARRAGARQRRARLRTSGCSGRSRPSARAQRRHGRRALERVIVSMTSSADDVLAAEELAAEAGAELRGVPLFETIDDLRRAPALVERAARAQPTRGGST